MIIGLPDEPLLPTTIFPNVSPRLKSNESPATNYAQLIDDEDVQGLANVPELVPPDDVLT